MAKQPAAAARRLVWGAMVILALLHHDFWLWNDRDLYWGFLPAGLAYHMLFSLLAAALWVAALRWNWPKKWEDWAGDDRAADRPRSGRSAS